MTTPRAAAIRLALPLLLVLHPAAAMAAPGGVTGWWLDQSGRAGIWIDHCGDRLCGWIEWLRAPRTQQGQEKTDIHNPDPARRAQPLCGLNLLGGFTPDGAGRWSGGWIYDPESGSTYKSAMHLLANGTLQVRGYIGIPLLGRSQVWTRPVPPPPSCVAQRRP